MTLVLDLNGVLCQKVEKNTGQLQLASYDVNIREGALSFLTRCASSFRVGLFTSTTEKNARKILKNIPFEWAFTWFRDKTCPDNELSPHGTLKPIDSIKGQVLLVDDDASKMRCNDPSTRCIAEKDESFDVLYQRIHRLMKAQIVPPKGWEKVFYDATAELDLVKRVISLDDICPHRDDLFRAFELCPLSNVNVVIIDSSPSGKIQQGRSVSNGMAFSTHRGNPITDVQSIIYKELFLECGNRVRVKETADCRNRRDYFKTFYRPDLVGMGDDNDLVRAEYDDHQFKTLDGDALTDAQYDATVNAPLRHVSGMTHDALVRYIGMTNNDIREYVKTHTTAFTIPSHGDLSNWARQGVLLLNACLTTSPGRERAHGEVWNGFLRRVLEAIEQERPNCIFLLWGKRACDVGTTLSQRSIIKTASYPSKGQATRKDKDVHSFAGCGHFTFVNKHVSPPIDWRLD